MLSIVELAYLGNLESKNQLKPYLRSIVETEVKLASDKGSAFEIVWLIFFSRYLGLGITKFSELITKPQLLDNPYVKCMMSSQNKLYAEAGFPLFVKPADCKGTLLVDQLDVFKRNIEA